MASERNGRGAAGGRGDVAGRGRPSRAVVYERLDSALAELNERFGGLPDPRTAETIWDDIWHQEAHHSTALEGNTLVLREVRTLLDQGRAVGAKPLAEYNEVRGYADAARWVYAQALEPGDWHDGRLLTVGEVRQVHHMAMTAVWDVAPHPDATDREAPGSFREHDIHPFSAGMTPPTWPLVPVRMQEWIDEVCAVGARIETAAQRGRLAAYRGADGIWRSSRSAVDAYRDTRQKRPYQP